MSKIENLQKYHHSKGSSVYSVFRQLVSKGGIKFSFAGISVEPQEHDLQRIHDIINEIDERRAFYDNLDDEIPKHVMDSVLEAKASINNLRRGLWANTWARETIQLLLHELGAYLTKTQNRRLPRNLHDKGFDTFEKDTLELRLKVWTIVAHLVVVFGAAVSAMHLPDEIREEVWKEYKKSVSST